MEGRVDRGVVLGVVIASVAWGIALTDAIGHWRAGGEVSAWTRAPAWTGAVEVRGAVDRPGVQRGLAGATVREALARARPRVQPRGPGLEAIVEEGARIALDPDGRVAQSRMPGRQLLVLGLRIPLDAASPEDLEALAGVGPVMAGRIVAFRDGGATIRKIEDLDAVRGIGPKTLERIRPHLQIAGPPDALHRE